MGDGEEASCSEVVVEGDGFEVFLDSTRDVPCVAVGIEGAGGEVGEDRGEEGVDLGGALGGVFLNEEGLGGVERSRSTVRRELLRSGTWNFLSLRRGTFGRTFA